MNILVTGGAGYIGKIFIEKYHKKFNKIYVIDNLYDSFNEGFPNNVIFLENEFGDQLALDKVFSNKIECVFHFAAFAAIGESNSNPRKFFDNNVGQMLTLLNKMIDCGCKKLIFSSSAATFGNPVSLPIDENHSKKPINSYGETKLIGEKMLKWYNTAYGLKSISLRYFNAAGAYGHLGEKRKKETHILPLIFDAIKNNKVFYIFGNDYNTSDGTCVRDYIHIEDLVDAHMLSYTKLDDVNCAYFNLGSENGTSNLDLIKITSNLLNKELKFEFKKRRSGDPDILIASSENAKKTLGWNNKKSIEDIISSLIKYYKIK